MRPPSFTPYDDTPGGHSALTDQYVSETSRRSPPGDWMGHVRRLPKHRRSARDAPMAGGKSVSDHYELKKIDLERRHARRLQELESQREKESEKK